MRLQRRYFVCLPVLVFVAIAAVTAREVIASEMTPSQQAVHVLNRLGYGPRPGDIEQVMKMGVSRYIEQQLDPASIPLPSSLQERLDAVPITGQSAGSTLGVFLAARLQAKDQSEQATQQRRQTVARITEETAHARLIRAIESPRQLEEVMVDFWFNHFNVFLGKGLDRALVASYERDAIRPYAMGSFRDLLGATAKHPAMLFYLDNYLSTADGFQPRGALGAKATPKAKAAGLNENYAREVMELHTLGVDAGYSQGDVTQLARMLTGWTFEPRQLAMRNVGFRFDAQRHDTGEKEWLGHHVGNQGQSEGEYALDVLAQHPATAHRISFLLAQYFVQDSPPPVLVDRMTKRYLESHGDIRAVLRTLFFSPEFMGTDAVGAKFKTPYQFVVSAVRATGAQVENVRPLLGALNQLGMPLYGCQTPDGYKTTEAAWLNPESLSRRIAFASALPAGKLPLDHIVNPGAGVTESGQDPSRMSMGADPLPADGASRDPSTLQQTMGPMISARTQALVDSSPQALRAAMLLGSPDFMRH